MESRFHMPSPADVYMQLLRSLGLARLLLILPAFCLSPSIASGLGETHYVHSSAVPGGMNLFAKGKVANIYVDKDDYPGVIRAAHDLQTDVERVSGVSPEISNDSHTFSGEVILIGTIGKSKVLDRLIGEHKLDVNAIAGKWESTLVQIIDHPLRGVTRALVIAGSDKRGAIFGIYGLSEQIGVSPWYWWADVPVQHKDALYVAPGRYVEGEPAVKYRGIFLNDEAPSLSGWVKATYGGYNHNFYVKVFELLLRLRANYLWPAMWNSAFNEDDPENARLADEYGIVMGTSHHEPMLRAQQEWKRHGTGPWDYAANAAVLDRFWAEGIERNKNYESTITLGMRGDGDMPMTEGANIALLERIVADQRKILAEHATPILNANPKVWALYKEVQQYYEKGMRVPDDVTLLWCDDNWGNIRRLPTPEERNRPGGAGIYYHFDYVGDPRNYKWINTNPIAKVWEQMNLALTYGATRIWIVNVGDLKPLEFPTEFFLTMARNPKRWGKDQLDEYTQLWAEREFGSTHAEEISQLITTYTRYNGRRKPELLDTETFNLTNYSEADRVAQDWKSLLAKAEALQKEIPVDRQDAFFELVLHPIKASAIVNQMYIAAARNHLYATQGRASANDFAAETRALFKADATLSDEYNHKLAHGKWNHMMDQTHIGYTYWQQPPINVMPAVSEVQPDAEAVMGISAEGIADVNAPQHISFDSIAQQTRFIDVFNHGVVPFHFDASTTQPWIRLSSTHGEVSKDMRLQVHVDWSMVPAGKTEGDILVAQQGGSSMKVHLTAFRPDDVNRESVHGFVESDGYVSIEAEHYSRAVPSGTVHWDRIPNYGATLSGMTVFPVTTASVVDGHARATLEYGTYLFDRGELTVQATIAPTLNFVPGRGLRFAVSFDEQPPTIVDVLEHNTDADWAKAVSDSVRLVQTKLNVSQPGYHTLKFGMVDPGIVLEKLVVSAGPIKASYLGPPESYHHQTGIEEQAH
jgi:hypothetical protein